MVVVPNFSLLHASHSVKLIWGKHRHRGNHAKGAQSTEESQEEAKCPLCNKTDSWQHGNKECEAKPTQGTCRGYIALVTGDIQRQKGKPTFQNGNLNGNSTKHCSYSPSRSGLLGGNLAATAQTTTQDGIRQQRQHLSQCTHKTIRESTNIL